ncbi:glycosyltransferase family 39 protein [Blastomonas sp.]|uniref:glycosyltransferase family 39 protein n=1 Tax=Blastomonas sp. TaxID=1909299 RepID=UPI00391D22CA
MLSLFERTPVRFSLMVFLGALLALFLLMNRDINIYDEGIVLTGGLRTLAGDIPHRDYYSTYGPGQNYILAFIMKFFGHDILYARVYSILTMAAAVVVVYGLSAKRVSWIFALIPPVFCLAFFVGSQFHLYPVFPVILLSMTGSLFLLNGNPGYNITGVAIAGALAGVAALFRYDSGFFILAAQCLALIIIAQGQTLSERMTKASIQVTVYGIASAATFFPFALSYLSVADFNDFYGDIIEFPINYYAEMRGLPFPGPKRLISHPEELAVYFPVLVMAVAGWDMLATKLWRRTSKSDSLQFPLMVIMMTMTVILYYKGVVRVGTSHMLMSIVPATVLCGLLADRLAARANLKTAWTMIAVLGLAPGLVVARELLIDVIKPDRTVLGWAMGLQPAEQDDCTPLQSASAIRLGSDYLRVSNYIRQHSLAEERIFAALGRHDKIFVNPVYLYFSTDRLPGTHWHHFDPGLQTRADIQTQIVADLQRNKVNWVVRDFSFDDIKEPNKSSRSSGVKILDEYLASRYRPVASSGETQIWLAKTQKAPQETLGLCSAN